MNANISTKNKMSYFAEDITSEKAESFLEKVKNCRMRKNVMKELKWQRMR